MPLVEQSVLLLGQVLQRDYLVYNPHPGLPQSQLSKLKGTSGQIHRSELEGRKMALRGFSKFEQMFRAKLASDAPLHVLKAKKEKEGLSEEEVRQQR